MRWFFLAVCLLATTACDDKHATGPTVVLNEQFTLAPGEAAAIQGTSLRVQFIQVTGDSRCPADALCIQGGDAIVHVRAFDGARARATFELHTGDSSRAAVGVERYRLELVQLAPYPFSSKTIQPHDYRVTLRLSG